MSSPRDDDDSPVGDNTAAEDPETGADHNAADDGEESDEYEEEYEGEEGEVGSSLTSWSVPHELTSHRRTKRMMTLRR